MKKIVSILLVLVTVYAQAQDVKEITEDYNAYSKLLSEKNFEKAFGYLNEGIFTVATREQLLEVMKQTLANPAITFEMSMPEVSGFTDAKKIGETYYVKFNSFNIIRMKFTGMFAPDKSQEELNALVTQMKEAFNAKFGAENVSYDDKTQFFQLKSTKPVIAASADKKAWKFITIDDESQKPMLAQFIPAEILN